MSNSAGADPRAIWQEAFETSKHRDADFHNHVGDSSRRRLRTR
jgi:hypothetical protein